MTAFIKKLSAYFFNESTIEGSILTMSSVSPAVPNARNPFVSGV